MHTFFFPCIRKTKEANTSTSFWEGLSFTFDRNLIVPILNQSSLFLPNVNNTLLLENLSHFSAKKERIKKKFTDRISTLGVCFLT